MLEHYKPEKISSITKKDSKISIVGKVIAINKNSFTLEDDSGKIELFSEEEIESNKVVRVFCSLVEGKLKADVIQILNGLDLNLFKKVEELYYKAGLHV